MVSDVNLKLQFEQGLWGNFTYFRTSRACFTLHKGKERERKEEFYHTHKTSWSQKKGTGTFYIT